MLARESRGEEEGGREEGVEQTDRQTDTRTWSVGVSFFVGRASWWGRE